MAAQENRPRLLISACLLGEPCRYDGRSKPCDEAEALKSRYELIAVCPEVLGGLPTPREASEIRGDKVVARNGVCVTRQFRIGAEKALLKAKENGCTAAVLKARSPSCSKGKVYDGSFTGTLIDGNGIAAQLLLANSIAVYTEEEIEKLL